MSKYAIIENGVVTNVVVADSAIRANWVEAGENCEKGGTYSDGAFTRKERPVTPITWDDIRQERDFLLSRSDWTQISDSPLSDEDKAAWQTYRQALRDITETYTSLDDVVWPGVPNE